ncbi:MAG: MoaD/ThiS family protein [bacterium]
MVTKLKMGERDVTWELVYKRNKVERLKNEKFPLDVLDDLPELIETKKKEGLEAISEDDMVRLYWYGWAHDKPKVGQFMSRLKVPCGIVTPDQLLGVGKISEEYGDNYSELTTRMGIQYHNIDLEHLPDVYEAIHNTGLTNKGAEGDTVRNVTGCPLTGINPHETFDVRPVIDEVHDFFSGNPDYSDLPRKLKFTITSCPLQCSGPEFHGIALIAVRKDGERGFAVKTGGGLSSTPRIARDLEMFVPENQALDVLRGLTDLWNETLRYRLSRPKSRIKFMVDDHGPEKIRSVLEEELGREFEDYEAPEPDPGDQSHLGVLPQKQDNRIALGYSVPQGRVKGHQLRRIADVLDDVEGEFRITREQNFILANIPRERVQEVKGKLDDIGFSLDEQNKIFGHSVACTSHKYCNFSVARTKDKAQEILEDLVEEFGEDIEEGLTIKMDGCPNACGQHWMGHIGLQGTTARSESGDKIDAYDVTLGGGTGSEVNIGDVLFRKIPTAEVNDVIHRLVKAWVGKRSVNGYSTDGSKSDPTEERYTFKDFCDEHSEEQLRKIGLGGEADEAHRYGQVTLRLSGPLVDYAGGIEQHEFREAAVRDVRSLVGKVTRRYKSLGEEIPLKNGDWSEHVNFFLNDEDIREHEGLDTPVEDGDEVLVLPAISGG